MMMDALFALFCILLLYVGIQQLLEHRRAKPEGDWDETFLRELDEWRSKDPRNGR